MSDLQASILLFTALVMTLVTIVLIARALLAPRGAVVVEVNGERALRRPAGIRLLEALHGAEIPVPAACGGKGTCGLCRVRVLRGGGPVHPLESDRLARADLAAGARLACQVRLREDVGVVVPSEYLHARTIETVVRSSRQVATLLREIVLDVPAGEAFPYPTGSFVQVTCPAYTLRYADLDIDPQYCETWERMGLLQLTASSDAETTRAYSLAGHTAESGLMLVVRLATPPPGKGADVPPGVVSSWLFGLRPGQTVDIAGPYGDFFVDERDTELVFVGGGAGIAPMRAHILDQLERVGTERPVTFFYGARNARELVYAELFDRLAATHANFRWTAALSEPEPDEAWEGPVGFIHESLRRWVETHAAPEACGYYLCGPPLMIRAVQGVLDGVGVPPTAVHADDFGG